MIQWTPEPDSILIQTNDVPESVQAVIEYVVVEGTNPDGTPSGPGATIVSMSWESTGDITIGGVITPSSVLVTVSDLPNIFSRSIAYCLRSTMNYGTCSSWEAVPKSNDMEIVCMRPDARQRIDGEIRIRALMSDGTTQTAAWKIVVTHDYSSDRMSLLRTVNK